MDYKIRRHIVDAVKRITESTWRGREHTEEETVGDIENFLEEEGEGVITELEWQAIFEQFPIGDLSGKIFQIKNLYVKRHGKVDSITKELPQQEEKPLLGADDPLELEKQLIQQLRIVRKQGVKKVVSIYKDTFNNEVHLPTNKELIDFIKENSLEEKDNRRTVIIALSSIVGLERIRRIFDIIEKKRPFNSKMELFEMWLKRQKKQINKEE